MSAGRGSPAPRTPGIDAGAAVARPGAGPFDRRVIGVGGVVFALLMTLSARYGFNGDELYMPGCSNYLAAAYVYLLAAGAVAIDGWLQARPGRLRNLMLAT